MSQVGSRRRTAWLKRLHWLVGGTDAKTVVAELKCLVHTLHVPLQIDRFRPRLCKNVGHVNEPGSVSVEEVSHHWGVK